MAIYNPPTEDLPIFDSSVFESNNAGLTIGEGDLRYLRWPVSQGSETISGNLTVTGSFAPTTLTTNTIIGTAVGTPVSLYNEASRTGTVSIATGTGTRQVNIGGVGSSTSIFGSTCDVGCGPTTTAVNIAHNGFFAGILNIAAVGAGIKTINIGTTTNSTLNLIGSAITASLMSITGTLSAAASTLSSVITNTITGTTMSIQPTVQLNLADTLTSGSINIGRQDVTATTTTVNLAIGNGQTGAISVGTGTGTKTITIGNDTATTTALRGSSITATRMAITNALSAAASTLTSVITNTITGTAVGTAVSLYSENSRSAAIDIGNGSSRSGDIRIGSGATTSGAVLIGRNGGGVSIGTSGSTNTIDGTTNFDNGTHTVFGITNINTTGSNLTTLGNATASTQIGGVFGVTGATTLSSTLAVTGNATFNGNTTLGNAAADEITPTGTVKVPFTIGYASWSNSATTNVTTYLGGTLQTSKTQNNVATGTFSYMMSSVTPYSVGGGVTLSGGTYMFWMGINMEDAAAFDVTDLRMGLTTSSTLVAGSTEADYLSGLPNLTCYFHKTDSANAAINDSENRVLSGCFYNSLISATYYPFYYINNNAAGGIDTVETDILIVKIGGGN